MVSVKNLDIACFNGWMGIGVGCIENNGSMIIKELFLVSVV